MASHEGILKGLISWKTAFIHLKIRPNYLRRSCSERWVRACCSVWPTPRAQKFCELSLKMSSCPEPSSTGRCSITSDLSGTLLWRGWMWKLTSVRLGALARALRVLSFRCRNSGEILNIRLTSSKLSTLIVAQRMPPLTEPNCQRAAPERRNFCLRSAPSQRQKNLQWREPKHVLVCNVYFAACSCCAAPSASFIVGGSQVRNSVLINLLLDGPALISLLVSWYGKGDTLLATIRRHGRAAVPSNNNDTIAETNIFTMMHGNTKSKPHCLANACFHSTKGECHITESKLKRSEFRKYDKVENLKLYYTVTSFSREIIDPEWCVYVYFVQFIRYLLLVSPATQKP